MRNVMDILDELKKINNQIAEAPEDTQSDEAALELLKMRRLELELERDNAGPKYLRRKRRPRRSGSRLTR